MILYWRVLKITIRFVGWLQTTKYVSTISKCRTKHSHESAMQKVNQIFGYRSGLGFSLLSFDWAQIALIGSPLATPCKPPIVLIRCISL
jgi:hypothetical protein